MNNPYVLLIPKILNISLNQNLSYSLILSLEVIGIYSIAPKETDAWAGYFNGNVNIVGTLYTSNLSVASGIYIYQIRSTSFVSGKKMILLK